MSFHVPELARVLDGPLRSTGADGCNGAFEVESPEPGWRLALICSDGSEFPDNAAYQWEHVSLHAFRDGRIVQVGLLRGQRATERRTPSWREMVYVKDLCWDPEDVVMQLHPARSEYVNVHPNVLHLWRPKLQVIPTPPKELVG